MQLKGQLKMMGTIIDIVIEDDKADEKIRRVTTLLELYNQRFSANDEASELMKVNHNAGQKSVQVHPQLFELIKIGKKESLANPGNLNIAIGPLVQTWRIGFEDVQLPSDALIQEKLLLTNPEEILLDEEQHRVFLAEVGMKIDLGALAKGYIADLIMEELRAEKVSSALINLGGNVLVHGKNPARESGEWLIGIQNPKAEKHSEQVGFLSLQNRSVVTSGIYERKFEKDGKIYHHIFDKKTGYPIETEMASLTIVSDKSLDCEIWTTRLFGLPLPQVIEEINQRPEIEGLIITQKNQILLSEGIKKIYYSLSQ